MRVGTVHLIGAGPGDPGLITCKAVQCLKTADVIVYDYLANEAILEHARKDAELIYAGKMGGCHSMPQEEINRLLEKKAKEGKEVVRLKGGDPYIFGRGGEEASHLFKHGVPVRVIPGITSAIAAPAYAGIPLTDRRHASSVTLITGHEDPTKPESSINWEKISTGSGTLVFLMGVKNLPGIVKNLVKHGRNEDTPAAIIQQGTTPFQRTVTGTLRTIEKQANEAVIKPPSIILVGSVVELRPSLNWFETRPLFGKTVIVTRARQQASMFLEKLEDLGARALAFPTIETVPPSSWKELDDSIDNLTHYHWVIFTSVNGVRYFKQRVFHLGMDSRAFAGVKVAAIGSATAVELRTMGIKADFVPSEYKAESVVEGLKDCIGPGIRVLIPRAKKAREVLPDEMRKAGADVDVVPAYETILPGTRTAEIKELFENGAVDMVTFTSSSTVTNFCDMFPHTDIPKLLIGVTIACIGPITAKTAQNMGLKVHIQPELYTIDGLIESIITFVRHGNG